MRAGAYALLLAAFGLAGCDRLTGAANQKILDAEAIGYACRVSLKVPEDCMKENETHSPTSILKGWRSADKAIMEGLIDPSMGKNDQASSPVPVAAEEEPPADKAAKDAAGSKGTEPAAKTPTT
ncbi:MAG: hypothetical protein U1D70_05955 [Methylobacter sp.]|nr:hypothetical protein [Methylobacter sp.]